MNCRVCGVEHDRELHAAVLAVHFWLRARLALALRPVPVTAPPTALCSPLCGVHELRSPRARRKAAK